MRVLLDTSVWSAVIRRGKCDIRLLSEVKSLIEDDRVAIIGPIRQEILSGIRETAQFDLLKNHLEAFPDLTLSSDDFALAADFFNKCRSRGIQGSNTDFLICAVAVRHRLEIFTTDRDFEHFAKCLPIILHSF